MQGHGLALGSAWLQDLVVRSLYAKKCFWKGTGIAGKRDYNTGGRRTLCGRKKGRRENGERNIFKQSTVSCPPSVRSKSRQSAHLFCENRRSVCVWRLCLVSVCVCVCVCVSSCTFSCWFSFGYLSMSIEISHVFGSQMGDCVLPWPKPQNPPRGNEAKAQSSSAQSKKEKTNRKKIEIEGCF